MAWRWRTKEPVASKGWTSWVFPSPRTGQLWFGQGALTGAEAGPRELMAGRKGDQELGERTARVPGPNSKRRLVLVERAQRTVRSKGCQGRLTGAAGDQI